MNVIRLKKSFQIFTNLKFAIFILLLIAIASSVGSIIEQNENLEFYKTNYSLTSPIFGFVNWKIIVTLGLDHIYTTFWFLLLLLILGISLISCTLTRQFPVYENRSFEASEPQRNEFLDLHIHLQKQKF